MLGSMAPAFFNRNEIIFHTFLRGRFLLRSWGVPVVGIIRTGVAWVPRSPERVPIMTLLPELVPLIVWSRHMAASVTGVPSVIMRE